jgi:hypothetical protein
MNQAVGLVGVLMPEAEEVEVEVAESALTFQAALARLVDLDNQKRGFEKRLDEIKEEISALKEFCKDQFIDMGVNSMRAHGKTIYLHQQLWTGVGEGVQSVAVADELRRLNLAQYVTVSTQGLSGYTRELARDNPELCDERGEITADPDEILATMPGQLPELLKIANKIDIKIKK